MRWATRCRRAICCAEQRRARRGPSRRRGSRRWRPRAMPRTPHSSLNAPQAPRRGGCRPTSRRTASPARAQGRVGIAGRQLPGDPGQAGAEGEGLDPGAAGHRRRGRSAAGPGRRAPSSRTTSTSSTSRRGRSPGSEPSAGRSVSPPVRMAARTRAAQVGPAAGPATSGGGGATGRWAPATRRSAMQAHAPRPARRRCRRRSPCGAAPRPGDQRTT